MARNAFCVPVEVDGVTYWFGESDEVWEAAMDAADDEGKEGQADVGMGTKFGGLISQWFTKALRDWEGLVFDGEPVLYDEALSRDVPFDTKIECFSRVLTKRAETMSAKVPGSSVPT